MYYFEDIVAEVCLKAGIRAVLSEGILDFPVPNNPSPDHALEYTEMLINKYSASPLIDIAVGPHTPYTCSPQLLQKSRELANKYDVLLNIHLAETKFEFDQCLAKNSVSPVKNLLNLGILSGKTIAAHSVHVTQEDIQILSETRTGVATNPVCNMKLASGTAPIPEMLRAGINAAIGTDGPVSNNNLNMFEEMKTLALVQKLVNNDPSIIDAKTIVKMASETSAKALGIYEKTGSLEKGKLADIIIIDLNKAHLNPIYNIFSNIVYSMSGNDVDTVIINGRIVMKEKKLIGIDEEAIIAEVNEKTKNIVKDFSIK